MVFDPVKFEAIHITRKCNLPNLDIELLPTPFAQDLIDTRIVKPTPKNLSIRWLGVYFDARLSFKCYVKKTADKDRKVVAALKMLKNTIQGVETKIISQVVHAYILPIFIYVATAWWPGQTRLDQKGKTVRNGVKG